MNKKDPKLVARQFNACINNRDLDGLTCLMTADHIFVDPNGKVKGPRFIMMENWREFFTMFPSYGTTIEKIQSVENTVMMLGHAYWSEDGAPAPAIWMAIVDDDLVQEWRIYADTPENRSRFGLL
jgi:ketosteroid isomerase-like protein